MTRLPSSRRAKRQPPLRPFALVPALLVAQGLPALAQAPEGEQAPQAAQAILDQSTLAQPDTEAAILVDAADARIDRRTDELIFTDIIITQDTLSVSAERAVGTGLSFESSDWTFSGNVKLTSDGAMINATEALLSFRDNRLHSAALTGPPVTFRRESTQVAGQFARGRAQRMDYDVTNESVRLSGDAWLCEGGNEITSEVIVYQIEQEQVMADGGRGEDGRVKILITPGDDDENTQDCDSVSANAP